MALSICVAVSANCPEYGMIRPILTVSWALTGTAASSTAARLLSLTSHLPTSDLRIDILPHPAFIVRRLADGNTTARQVNLCRKCVRVGDCPLECGTLTRAFARHHGFG